MKEEVIETESQQDDVRVVAQTLDAEGFDLLHRLVAIDAQAQHLVAPAGGVVFVEELFEALGVGLGKVRYPITGGRRVSDDQDAPGPFGLSLGIVVVAEAGAIDAIALM